MKIFFSYILASLLSISTVFGALQLSVSDSTKMANWHHLDDVRDGFYGISLDKAYQEILKDKKSRTIVVAVLDTGVDIDHEDLKENIWVNEKEIPGNSIDDDGNGYIDDIHGWNFLGNEKGEHISHETLELTRLYRSYTAKFRGKKEADIPAEDKEEYIRYLEIRSTYLDKLDAAKQEYGQIMALYESYKMAEKLVQEALEKEEYTIEELNALEAPASSDLHTAKAYLMQLQLSGLKKKDLEEYAKYVSDQVNYHLNPDHNPRKMIGDDPEIIDGKPYGNNDVKGMEYEHGTHVAGIIAAVRNNGLGINGVADNVKIMAVRIVPNGDERDKDIANGIRYAVDNGAQVINMSFGKTHSPQKHLIDDAVKYAEEKGVLIIHAAGNEALDLDKKTAFPTNIYADGKTSASNWITVGATSHTGDQNLVADFSNYGYKSVDVFAPGVNIYSVFPGNKYELQSGTSMAAPVASGVAALLMAYYPTLTAGEIREILLESAVKPRKLKVNLPSEGAAGKKERFDRLSVTGGVINAYEAVKLAEKRTAKK